MKIYLEISVYGENFDQEQDMCLDPIDRFHTDLGKGQNSRLGFNFGVGAPALEILVRPLITILKKAKFKSVSGYVDFLLEMDRQGFFVSIS